MHHVTKTFMNYAKARYNETKGSIIDERFVEIVDLFNKIHGVQTMWSCSGHTREEQQITINQYKNELSQPLFDNNSDIIFVVSEDHSEKLIKMISTYIESYDVERFLLYRPELRLFKLLAPVRDNGKAFTYNALQIKLKHKLLYDDFTVYDEWYLLINHILDKQ